MQIAVRTVPVHVQPCVQRTTPRARAQAIQSARGTRTNILRELEMSVLCSDPMSLREVNEAPTRRCADQ